MPPRRQVERRRGALFAICRTRGACESPVVRPTTTPAPVAHFPTRLRLLGDSGFGTYVPPIPRLQTLMGSLLVLNRAKEDLVMLVELSMLEQRYDAVGEVLDAGITVTDVATR